MFQLLDPRLRPDAFMFFILTDLVTSRYGIEANVPVPKASAWRETKMDTIRNPGSDGSSEWNLLSEECLTFAKAARRLPKVRGNKHPSPSTLYRWATQGRRSRLGRIVKLEYVRIGGTNCTSMQALTRFFRNLADDAPSTPSAPSGTAAPTDGHSPREDRAELEKRAARARETLRRRGLIK